MTNIRPTRRKALTTLAASAALLLPPLAASAAQADTYPSKPITIVVAYPPGGDTDVLARLIGEKLSSRLGQPVIVENRTGAGGAIGTSFVAKAPADGYTLLLAPNTVAITPHVLNTSVARVDPAKDLTPIIQLASQSLFVVVATSTGVTSMSDLVASVKAGKIQTYASPGIGSPMHILAELFDKVAGVRISQIPYRGSVPAIADMVGGQVPMMYSSLGPVLQHIESGKLLPLAVADPQRSPFLPKVPTLAELGYAGAEVGAWQALMGPKGLPSDIVNLLNRHCDEILKLPDVAAHMKTSALQPVGGAPGRMTALARSDYEKYAKLVKEFGIRAD